MTDNTFMVFNFLSRRQERSYFLKALHGKELDLDEKYRSARLVPKPKQMAVFEVLIHKTGVKMPSSHRLG